jgi:hypothetical protein
LSYLGAGAIKGGLLWEGLLELRQRPDGRIVAAAWSDNPAASPGTSYGGGAMDVLLVRADLLPEPVERLRPSTGACLLDIDLAVNEAPRPGALGFELICNDAPPFASGILLVGTPLAPTPVVNIALTTLPLLAVPVSAADGFARTPLPLPESLPPLPWGLSFQYVWLTTASCTGSGPLAASDSLTF